MKDTCGSKGPAQEKSWTNVTFYFKGVAATDQYSKNLCTIVYLGRESMKFGRNFSKGPPKEPKKTTN